MKKLDHIPTYEEFMMNEEVLEPQKQPQILKAVLKSFDLEDLKYYLKGMMLELDITTRKKLTKWIDEGKYRQTVNSLIQHTDADPQAVLKLRKIYKVIMMDVKAGEDAPEEEI